MRLPASQADAPVSPGETLPGPGGPPTEPVVVPALAALFAGLEREGIRTCVWKSTLRLPEMLRGETDVDILVDEGSSGRWEELIAGLGFKPFLSHSSRRFPGLEDRIGLDAASGRLLHLHVHYQLLLGERYVKNHHLPIEEALLSSCRLRGGVPIPPPELELAILTLRSLVKYRDVDALRDLLHLGHRGGLPPDVVREALDLASRIDRSGLSSTVGSLTPMIPPALVEGFLAVVEGDRRDARAILRLRRRARLALRPYERRSTGEARRAYLRARLIRTWPLSLVTKAPDRRQARRKSPATGGTTIAVIGADGSGKSSLVDSLLDWLASRVRTRSYYMGSARPSVDTWLIGLPAKAARRPERAAARLLGPDHRLTRACAGVSRVLAEVRAVAEARERRRRSRAGRRAADAGAVVIFDRYPLDGVRLADHPVDGPRIVAMGGGLLAGRLGRLEAAAYQGIPDPDHVLVLDVDAAVAAGRREPRDPEVLRQKVAAIAGFRPPSGLDCVRIDANRTQEEVLRDARDAVWRWL